MLTGQRSGDLKNRSEEYFDRVASQKLVIPEPELCYGIVSERLASAGGGRLADIGCGTGGMLRRILEDHPDVFELHGLDLSGESLKRAEECCGGKAGLTRGDAEHLPYGDGSFDLLLCMHSFHHYPHPLRSLKEMRRVLRPGGRLFLVENDYPVKKRIRINLRLLKRGFPDGDIHMYSRTELRLAAVLAGFRTERHVHIADHSQLLECRRP